MTDQVTDVASGGSEPAPIAAPVAEHKAGGDGPISARDAARSLVDWRRKQPDVSRVTSPDTTGERAEPATPVNESTPVDAAPPQEATGETQEADPAEMPPLERPRSWTKEQDEHWKALPRATQEYLIDRASKDSAEVRRVQNEAAEHRKVIETERQRLTQLASQYESSLPQVVSMLQQAQAQHFSDIKTFEDVDRLAHEDPVRFTQWQAHQMKLGAVQQEMAEVQQRQRATEQQQHRAFAERESAKLLEKVPELSDKDTFAKVTKSAVGSLKELGFTDSDPTIDPNTGDTGGELGKLWRNEAGISLHDHRLQVLIVNNLKYQELLAANSKAATNIQEKLAKVPPVQRPGTGQNKATAAEAQMKSLESRLDNASGMNALRAAAALTNARRAAKR